MIAPSVTLDFLTDTPFDGEVRNNGSGSAESITFDTNLEDLSVDVANLSSDWTYTAGTGVFTYVANLGVLANGAVSQLDFDLVPTEACDSSAGGSVVWRSNYTNQCGDVYATPIVVSSVGAVSGRPSLGLAFTSDEERLAINEAGQYVLELDWAQLSLIGDDPLVVSQVLPVGIGNVVVNAPTEGMASNGGGTITWSIPHTGLPETGSATLTVDYTAPADPCVAGMEFETSASTAAVSLTNVAGDTCALAGSADTATLLTNSPTGPFTQQFNVSSAPNGAWETGAFDDGDAVREDNLGEGEFITYTATYAFGSPYTGTWAGSSYKDFLGDLAGQAYVSGTAMVEVDGGLPMALTVSAPDPMENGIKIDLAQIAAIAGDANVANHTIIITYQTVVEDSVLAGAATAEFTEIVKLTVGSAMGDGAACNMGEFTQGDFVSVSRADARISVSMPDFIDVCEEFNVTFNVSNGTSQKASNILLTILPSAEYEILAGQTPAYGGDVAANSPVYTENLMGGVPTAPTISITSSAELDGGGSVVLRVRRKAGLGLTSTTIGATVDFDDAETSPAGSRAFQNSGSDAPFLVDEALLNLTVTPDSLTVTGTTAQWRVNVTNGGAGIAFGATLTDLLPTGLTPNVALSDTANAATGLTATAMGQSLSWDLGDMASEESIDLTVVVDISGDDCSIAAGANSVTAAWGCGGVSSQSSASNDPNFSFLGSELLVLHDASNSSATVCQDTGEVILIIQSAGASDVVDVTVVEDLATSSSGLSYVAATSMFSLDGTNYSMITGAPTVTAAGVITWTSANIPVLADLAGAADSAGDSTVYIKFRVDATEDANTSGGSISGSASGSAPCGDAVASPGETFTVPIIQPSIAVVVTGENVTNSTAASETVTGAPGDMVEWTIEITNSSTRTAQNVQFLATFPGSGATGGTLTFPSTSTAAITDGTWLTVDDLPASGTVTYTVEYVLGSNCVDDGAFEAEVTWGCNAAAAASANLLSSPSENMGSATLDMAPDFTGSGFVQSVTPLSNARAEIVVTVTNSGALASSIVLDEVLSGFEYDPTSTPTVTGDLSLAGVTLIGASNATPRFTFTGSLLADDSAVLTYRVVPTQGFDVLSDPLVDTEDVGEGDSAAATSGTAAATLRYDDPCSGPATAVLNTTIVPNVPDLDLLVDVGSLVVEDSTSYTFDFTIRNNGDRNSIADNIVFTPTLGAGWTTTSVTLITPGTGGTAGACGATCTEMQIGSLGQNDSALVRITATANDNGNSLQIQGDVTGSLYQNDGTDTGNDYSLDARRPAVVGVTFSSTITGTSETFTGEGDDPRKVAVGEEVTYRIDGRWFGAEPLTALEIKDTLPAGIGFVSAADVASTMSFNVYAGASGTTAPTTGDTGEIRFVLADLGSGIGTFSADLVGRILNVNTADTTSLVNPAGMTFDLLGLTFHSNNAADGYSGDVGDSDLHGEQSVAVQRAVLEVSTGVRNVTQGQMTYSMTTMGDAGDVLEYETVVTNTGSTAAFDVVLEDDPVSAKLLIVDGAADSIDNDGDSSTDEADEGTFVTGAGGTVTFDGSDNSALDQLDPMDTVTFLYRVTVASTVQPDETLTSGAAVEGASLDAVDGNQTGTAGALGATIGSEELTGDASADFEADMIDLTKVLVTTSEGGDTSSDVVVGEILQYRVAVVLPEGTVPTFKVLDSLDEGLSLVGTPAATFGWTPAPAQPSITPGVLPDGGSPLAVEWDFGSLTVPAGTDAQRTVTLEYFVQVENIAGNVGGQTLANSARYMFDTTTGMGSTVTVTVREPAISVTLAAAAATPTDAGARVTYTVVATSNGDTTAQDLGFVFTLPAGTTYVAASTTPTSGPVIGEPEVAVGSLTWGRQQAMPGPQDLDLVTTGGSNVLEFEFQIELGDSVEPEQEIDGALAVTWTSLDGATGTTLGGITAGSAGTALGERDGSSGAGGLNDHVVSDTTDSAAARAYANRVTATGDTVTGGGFRVGDVVTYTVEVDLQEGTVDDLTIEDTLPSGLEFVSFDAISPATGSNGFTFTAPGGANAPSAGTPAPSPGTWGRLSTRGTTSPRMTRSPSCIARGCWTPEV